ncbi:MAG TPA: rhomboid family intramembrane serine protease [Bacteroidia bacterium]|nr:rhomboid family intramembrane serine protease [Bacteroidia bacterium]
MIRPGGFNMLPSVVKNLLILNGLFFLATIVLENRFDFSLIEVLGLRFPFAEKFQPYQIISYLFMHGSFTHLFFNMFAVWMFGSVLENFWGAKKFIIFYVITGIGAAVLHYGIVYYQMLPTLQMVNDYLNSPSQQELTKFLSSEYFKISSTEILSNFNDFRSSYNALLEQGQKQEALNLSTKFIANYKEDYLNAPVVVGASGSLFGLLLAFGMLFPNSLLYLFFAIPIKAKYFVILYGALELYSGFTDLTSNVAHFAHLGGMLFGFILIKMWGTNRTY